MTDKGLAHSDAQGGVSIPTAQTADASGIWRETADASRHTPGPWEARQEFANRWRIESRALGEEYLPVSVGLACTTVLEVGVNNEHTAANARLIAAAPDLAGTGAFLLERLADFENRISTDEDAREFHGHVAPAIANFRNAIAKARGQ